MEIAFLHGLFFVRRMDKFCNYMWMDLLGPNFVIYF